MHVKQRVDEPGQVDARIAKIKDAPTLLRKHYNILDRHAIHVAGFNLSLIFCRLLGVGTPA